MAKRKPLPWSRPGRPGYHSRYSDLLRDGLSGVRIRGGGGDFPNPSRPALRLSKPSAERIPGYSRVSSGMAVALTTAPSSVEVEETVDLYFYSPFVRTLQSIGWNLHVPVTLPTRQYPNHSICMTVCSLKQTSYVTIYPALKDRVVRPKFDAKPFYRQLMYEGNSISKLQIVIEKNRMEIMTYKQHLFFNIISIQI